MRKLTTLFSLCLFAFTLCISSFSVAGSSMSTHPAATMEKDAKATNQPPLPMDDIQRFVTAIAAIRHYYISDPKDNTLFNNAIKGMVSDLDPHSTYLTAEELKELNSSVAGEYAGVGIELTTDKNILKVISPIDDTPAFKAGIKPGDLIIKIDGKLVQDLTPFDAIQRIKGKPGTKVKLTVVNTDRPKPETLEITRAMIKFTSIKSRLLDKHYGYVRISFFQGPVKQDLDKAIKKLKKESDQHLKGLVLDLRNNPGGLLDASADVADTFLSLKKIGKQFQDMIVYTKGRIPQSDTTLKVTTGDMLNGVPIVVLINGGSASASEIVAGALQDYRRAIIMGTRSFGKGSVQTLIPISDNTAVKLTTALYHTPSGRVIQARGIVPDVVVPALDISIPDKSKYLAFDEADYDNHLANITDKEQSLERAQLAQNKADITLADKDYQLYEALMMLRGVSSIHR